MNDQSILFVEPFLRVPVFIFRCQIDRLVPRGNGLTGEKIIIRSAQ